MSIRTIGTLRKNSSAMNIEKVVELFSGLAEIGIDQAIFNMPNAHEITPIETLGKEVIPEVADLRLGSRAF